MSTIRGSISISDSLSDASSTKALSAAKGKEVNDKVVKGDGAWGLLDLKWSARKFSPSAAEPWFRADNDQTLLSANWPDLVTELRNTKVEIGGASVFNVTGYATGTVTRLQLEDTLTTRNLLRALLEEYQFSKSYTATTNADGADDDTAFSNWGFFVRIASTIGTGANTPTVGQEFRIRYLTSLANTLSVTNRYICIDKDTSSSATTGTGTIEIYPFRIASAGTPTTTSAKWRKIGEAGLMTPGTTFYSGTDLIEVPANLRVRDAEQSHRHTDSGHVHSGGLTGGSVAPGGGSWGGIVDTGAGFANIGAQTTNTNFGTPRTAPNTRERNSVAYLYAYGKTYTP